MADDRPTITLADLPRLRAEAGQQRPAANDDDVQDIATAAMLVLRGLTRADKFKVLRRMRRLMGK